MPYCIVPSFAYFLTSLLFVGLHTWIFYLLAGQLLLAKGDIEQAFNAFKIVLDGDSDNVPALLGQVFELLCMFFKAADD